MKSLKKILNQLAQRFFYFPFLILSFIPIFISQNQFDSFVRKIGISLTQDLYFRIDVNFWVSIWLISSIYHSWKFKSSIKNKKFTETIILKQADKWLAIRILIYSIFVIVIFFEDSLLYDYIVIPLLITFILLEIQHINLRYIHIKDGKLYDIKNQHRRLKIIEKVFYKGELVIKTEEHRSLVINRDDLIQPSWEEVEQLVDKALIK